MCAVKKKGAPPPLSPDATCPGYSISLSIVELC